MVPNNGSSRKERENCSMWLEEISLAAGKLKKGFDAVEGSGLGTKTVKYKNPSASLNNE